MEDLTEQEHEEIIIQWIKDVFSTDVTHEDISQRELIFSKYGFDFQIKSNYGIEHSTSKVYSIVICRDGCPVYAVGIGNFEERIEGSSNYGDYLKMLTTISGLFSILVNFPNRINSEDDVPES